MCLSNVSKGFTINNMKKKKKKKTGLKLAVKTTSVDFNLIDTNNIFDIRKYLMKRTWHKKMFVLIKKHFLDIY